MNSLYVAALSRDATESHLREAFIADWEDGTPSGLLTVKINRDTLTRVSRCSGFLNFETIDDVQRTLQYRQYTEICGKPAVLKAHRQATTPEEGAVTPFKGVNAACNTFVTPIPEGMTEADLATICEGQFEGTFVSAHIPPMKKHGFVLFNSEEAANAAMMTATINYSLAATEESQPIQGELNFQAYRTFDERKTQPLASKKINGPVHKPVTDNTVTIHGQPKKWTETEVRDAVAPYGPVNYLRLVTIKRTSTPDQRPAAPEHVWTVEFFAAEAARKCIDGLNRRWLSRIDGFTLLNPTESERISLIAGRKKTNDSTPRLSVTAYQLEGPSQRDQRKPRKPTSPQKGPRKGSNSPTATKDVENAEEKPSTSEEYVPVPAADKAVDVVVESVCNDLPEAPAASATVIDE